MSFKASNSIDHNTMIPQAQEPNIGQKTQFVHEFIYIPLILPNQ